MKARVTITIAILVNLWIFSACQRIKTGSTSDSEQSNMHFAYDDSTLTNRVLPVMLPYNRLIAPAGTSISFGDPGLENHSLTAKMIPQSSILVVEGRYAITLVDTVTHKVVAEWAYKQDSKLNGLMSTYSGLAIRSTAGGPEIFWSAAEGDTKRSYVLAAKWDGANISIDDTIAFKPKDPSPLALPNELAINSENGKDFRESGVWWAWYYPIEIQKNSDLLEAHKKLLMDVAGQVFDRYAEAPVRAGTDTAEK